MPHKTDIYDIDLFSFKEKSRRIKLLYLILLIAVVILLPMAVVAFLQDNKALALADTISALYLCAVFFYQKKTHRDNLAIYAGIVFCAFFYLYLFVLGGVGNSAFLWFYTFPLFASFLLGSKKGLIVSLSTLAAAILYFSITKLSDFHFAVYRSDLMIRFFASVLVVILFSYVAEKNRESSYDSLEKANRELENLTTTLTDNNKKLIHEISQRKKSEENLVLEKQKADEANKTKSEFLANMSHELRTPLNHIIGFTDLVHNNTCGPLNDTQKEFLGDVLSSSKHLLSLINDILDLSKVEAGKMNLELSDIALEPFLEQSLTMIREKALKHRLRLTLAIQDDLTTLRGDERKLKQVLYNLLSNAAKFTPDGGAISINVSLLNDNEHQFTSNKPHKNWLKIAVQDTGIGLKQDEFEQIFKTFKQVDSSASRSYQGTGLGLALTRNFIELHGGTIWAESSGPDQGSTFTFIIPILS